jgi:hypothetical protein
LGGIFQKFVDESLPEKFSAVMDFFVKSIPDSISELFARHAVALRATIV